MSKVVYRVGSIQCIEVRGVYFPCRCLCFGFLEQMMYTLFFLRTGLHPSHSLFTDDRVFIPRICSSCLTPTAPTPASICFCCTPDRKFLSPFASDSRLKLNCENDREKNVGRDSDCGRIWRRVPVEAPRMERRDIIVGGPREDMDFGDPPVSRSGGRIRIYLILRRG